MSLFAIWAKKIFLSRDWDFNLPNHLQIYHRNFVEDIRDIAQALTQKGPTSNSLFLLWLDFACMGKMTGIVEQVMPKAWQSFMSLRKVSFWKKTLEWWSGPNSGIKAAEPSPELSLVLCMNAGACLGNSVWISNTELIDQWHKYLVWEHLRAFSRERSIWRKIENDNP